MLKAYDIHAKTNTASARFQVANTRQVIFCHDLLYCDPDMLATLTEQGVGNNRVIFMSIKMRKYVF